MGNRQEEKDRAIQISVSPDTPIRRPEPGAKPKAQARSERGPYRTTSFDYDPCKRCNCYHCRLQKKNVVCTSCPEGNTKDSNNRPTGCTGCTKRVVRKDTPSPTLGSLLFAALEKK